MNRRKPMNWEESKQMPGPKIEVLATLKEIGTN